MLAQMDTIFLQLIGGFWDFPTMSYVIDFSARGDIEINEICLTSHVLRFELIKDGRKSNFSRVAVDNPMLILPILYLKMCR